MRIDERRLRIAWRGSTTASLSFVASPGTHGSWPAVELECPVYQLELRRLVVACHGMTAWPADTSCFSREWNASATRGVWVWPRENS